MASEMITSIAPVRAEHGHSCASVVRRQETPAIGSTSCGLYSPRARKNPAQPSRFRFKEINTASKSTVDRIES